MYLESLKLSGFLRSIDESNRKSINEPLNSAAVLSPSHWYKCHTCSVSSSRVLANLFYQNMAEYLDSAAIKLLIDRKRECVVLGEAGKDYTDILNSIITFPMATVVRLARTQESFEAYGCFSNLYQSVEGLSLQCFKTPACKQMLVHPRHVEEEVCRKRKVKLDDVALTKYFECSSRSHHWKSGSEVLVSNYDTVRCEKCGKFMNNEICLQVDESEVEEIGNEGCYKALISDNLLYMPNHPECLLQYFRDHGIKCADELAEKIVTLGLEQISCLILNTAISKTSLTDTFLKKQVGVRVDPMKQPLISSTKKSTGKATPLTVEVLVRKSDCRILFAIADKGFVDLLFTFLTLPLMTVWRMIGFSYLFDGHWEAVQGYELPPHYSGHILLPNFKAQDPPSVVYSRIPMSPSPSVVYSRIPMSPSPSFLRRSDSVGRNEKPVFLIDPKSPYWDSTDSNGGYAKAEELFLVSDDLVVRHLASTSTFSLVKELGVPLSHLETWKISIGEKEALQLLEASFRSSSALNTAFGSLHRVPKEEA